MQRTNGIREGDVVYVRAIATKSATFYENGVAVDGVSLIPLAKDGTRFDFINCPPESIVSSNAIESAITKKVKERYGIE